MRLAPALVPYSSHGALIFWMYPVFGIRGATYFLGVAEWLFGALLFAGFWNMKLGILGALGSRFSFIATSTIIPFVPDGWAASAQRVSGDDGAHRVLVKVRGEPLSAELAPAIGIPVIAVAWQYTGMNPEELEGRITSTYERLLTTTVDNIEHLESTTVNGQAIVKLYLQPGSSLDTANAQVTAISQTVLRQLPPGTLPPLIINYSASSVPILQLGMSGQGLSEQQLNDLSQNFLRPQLVTVPGAVIPYSYGGKQRQVMVDLNEQLIQSKGLGPQDILNAVLQGNVILPSGTAKIGPFEYDVRMNTAPKTVAGLNDLPVKVVGDSTIYLHDVANIRDGFAPQTNIVRQDSHTVPWSPSSRPATLPPLTL